jgi:hypothetical protein
MNPAQTAALCVALTAGKTWERILAEVVARACEAYRTNPNGRRAKQ